MKTQEHPAHTPRIPKNNGALHPAITASSSWDSTSTYRPTEAALAVHNASPPVDDAEERALRLQEVARSLDFELPRECFEAEKGDLEDWLSAQGRHYLKKGDK